MPELQELNAEIWAISPDGAEAHAKMAEKEGIEFPILLDDDLAVIKAFGILNEDSPKVPHPTVVILDSEGIVRFFHLDEDYRQRPPAAEIVEAVRETRGSPGQ